MSKEHEHNHTHEQNHEHTHIHTHEHDDHTIYFERGDKADQPVLSAPDTELAASHDKWSGHVHDPRYTHGHPGVNDYMKAVAEYRKTFPSKQRVLEETPDPAVRDLILRMEQIGCDNVFDRFDAQQPQCTFGLGGVCCRICNMGPCKVTPKSPRGICGADADLIVARNLVRQAAGGVAQHGAHAREVLLSLKYAAQGKLDQPILGEECIRQTAAAFEISQEGKTINQLAEEVADVLLDDLSRAMPEEYKAIKYLAPEERRKVWADLDILPISAYNEVFDAYHRTCVGTDGDWMSNMKQFLRCGLAFTFTGVVAVNIATDALFGRGTRRTSKVNVGALKKDYVNIAVHGHLPTIVTAVIEMARTPEMQEKAKAAGAKGIQFYGICCSGLAQMYRYEGVIPLSNAIGAELVLATGALDLWMADVQDVYPAIMDVARCNQVTVVTTSDSCRLPGAEHYGYDHYHSNIGETKKIAHKIVERAIETHAARKDLPVFIPPYECTAEVGFSIQYLQEHYGSAQPIADALKSGKIRGIVNVVGCTNPKVVFERATVDIVDELLKNDIIVTTNGCASFPLLKLGYCTTEAVDKHFGPGLKEFLGNDDMPPVWHVGECIDNARSSAIFGAVAGACGHDLPDMPFAMSSPEWANEKGVDAALAHRLLGISSYHCVEMNIQGSDNVMKFIKEGTQDLLGSVMFVDPDPKIVAKKIIDDINEKRKALGWAY